MKNSMKTAIAILAMATMILTSFQVGTNNVGLSMSENATLTPQSITEDQGLIKITRDLRNTLGLADVNDVLDIVVELNSPNSEKLVRDLENTGISVNYQYENVDALAASATPSEILEFVKNNEVQRVYRDIAVDLPFSDDAKGNGQDQLQLTDFELTASSVNPISLDSSEFDPAAHANPFLTNADFIWQETNFGAGSVVAVLDTGCFDSVFYQGNLIGGIDLSFDVETPYEGYAAPTNHYHGTAVASQIASHVEIIFPGGSTLAESFYEHNPFTYKDLNGDVHVINLGTAPLASVYAVKIFDHWASSSTSIIMAGIDHAISAEVDVISMSLGGWTSIPGEDPMDLLLDAASDDGITVSVSAGNDGPSPLEIGSPASAKSAITVGAATDPIHERVYAGWNWGDPAYGYYYYPSNDLGIIYFSSRGPTADGRLKPDLVATGSRNWGPILEYGVEYLGWFGGTSFSCPVVSGGAALLAAYININGLPFGPSEIKDALIAGATPIEGYEAFEQGAGYLNLDASLDVLIEMIDDDDDCDWWDWWWQHGHCHWQHRHKVKPVLSEYVELLDLRDGTTTITDVVVNPQEFAYFAFEVSSEVDSVQITLSGVNYADYALQNPIFGDLGWFSLSTAIHSGAGSLFEMTPIYEDYESQVFTDFSFQAGILRIIIENEFYSYEPLEIDEITIEVREVKVKHLNIPFCPSFNKLLLKNYGTPIDRAFVGIYEGQVVSASDRIFDGEIHTYEFTVPSNLYVSLVELSWKYDHRYYGTSDLDFYIYDSDGYLVASGASIDSPEATYLFGAGTYTIEILGYQVNSEWWGERYHLVIYEFADYYWYDTPLWMSDEFAIDSRWTMVDLPSDVHGIAVVQHYQLIEFWGWTFEIEWSLGYEEV